MNSIQLLKYVTDMAKDYREGAQASIARNTHMNETVGGTIPQETIDAVLVDFINAIGTHNGIDYALYASDLRAKPPEPQGVPCNCLTGCRHESVSLERQDHMIVYCVKHKH